MRRKSVLVAALAAFAAFDSAAAQDGLRAGQDIPFVAGESFSPDRVPIRADARRLSESLERYGAAATPKAVALSADGLILSWTSQDPSRPPRSINDTRRMALQSCEFRAGMPCRLVASDNNVAVGEPTPIEALPKSGRFQVDRLPFWSTASLFDGPSKHVPAGYVAASGPKALAIAPLDSGRTNWSSGKTIEEAREKALQGCVSASKREGVKCVVFVEDDEVVYGATDGSRQLISGPKVAPKEIMLVYVGAHNCPSCAFWESQLRKPFLDSVEAKQIKFREVKAGTYMDTRGTAPWPDDIKWIRDQGAANSGTPRFIVVVDGKIARNIFGSGNWGREALPLLQRLVSQMAKST